MTQKCCGRENEMYVHSHWLWAELQLSLENVSYEMKILPGWNCLIHFSRKFAWKCTEQTFISFPMSISREILCIQQDGPGSRKDQWPYSASGHPTLILLENFPEDDRHDTKPLCTRGNVAGTHHSTGLRTLVLQKVPSEGSQSRRRPLLRPSRGWKRLLPLSHLRHY